MNGLTVVEARKRLRTKKFSSVELVAACLERIDEVDEKIKAFVTLCREEALSDAHQADELISEPKAFDQRPLLGIPVSVKDVFCTQGIISTAASNVLKNFVPPYDATVVKRLKDAGAIVLGKTNLDAFCHGSSTETSDFFPTRNPWNRDFLPGGSSGGSAASVIADECLFSVGTETAGSIRQPAAWCGVVGLKPTYGRVSRYGAIAMASSFDSPGPLTKTVADAALILNVLAGKDPLDATTSFQKVPDYLAGIERGVQGLKIGVSESYFQGVDEEVARAVKEAIQRFENLGGKICQISLFDPEYAISVYTILQRSEVSSNLARYDGIRYGFPRKFFGEESKRRIMLGTYTFSAGYYDQYYLQAQKVRTLICLDFDKAFKKVDVVVAPTSLSPALPVGSTQGDPIFGERQDILVEPSSIAGLPGLAIPCGFSKTGLPIGLQIIGPQFSEALLLRVGQAYEQTTDWHKKRPKL